MTANDCVILAFRCIVFLYYLSSHRLVVDGRSSAIKVICHRTFDQLLVSQSLVSLGDINKDDT